MERNGRRVDVFPLIVDLALFIAGGLVLLTQATIPTDWDSCQFVLGMSRFSPPDHQPHPPGYILFIYLARLLRPTGMSGLPADHAGLLRASALGAALLVPAIRRLTIKLFPGRHDVAIGASLLALGSPARLFFGAQALSYTWEGLFCVLMISLALDLDRKPDGDRTHVWLAWVTIWAVGSGFRPNLLLFYLPLAIYLLTRRRWWEILLAALILVIVTLAWFLPSAAASGGIQRYIDSLRGHAAFFLAFSPGSGRTLANIIALFDSPASLSGLSIIGWLLVLIVFLALGTRASGPGSSLSAHGRNVILLVAIPLLLFHAFLHYALRYSLQYAPVLLPLLARISAAPLDWAMKSRTSTQTTERTRPPGSFGWVIPAVIVLVSYYSFLAGTGVHSLRHTRSIERETRHAASFVRDLGGPEEVTIIAGEEFRRWGLALSEYTIWYPMHAIFPRDLKPRLAAMHGGDTIKGDFFQPDASESERVLLSIGADRHEQIVVLDEDAHRVLLSPREGWQAERITSKESLYWRRFESDLLLVDDAEGLVLAPVRPSFIPFQSNHIAN